MVKSWMKPSPSETEVNRRRKPSGELDVKPRGERVKVKPRTLSDHKSETAQQNLESKIIKTVLDGKVDKKVNVETYLLLRLLLLLLLLFTSWRASAFIAFEAFIAVMAFEAWA